MHGVIGTNQQRWIDSSQASPRVSDDTKRKREETALAEPTEPRYSGKRYILVGGVKAQDFDF